jgi:hypothetical protein
MDYKLSKASIEEFKRIMKDEYNEDLSDEEASKQAENLLSLAELVLRHKIDSKK